MKHFNKIKVLRHLATILLTIVFVSSLPLILLSVPLFSSIKLIVYCLAKLRRPDLKNFVPGSSVVLAVDDLIKKPKLNLITVFTLEENLEMEVYRSAFQRRIIERCKPNGKNQELMYPELQQYWTSYFNYLFWKQDKNFDLKNHIRLYDYTEDDLQLKNGTDGSEYCDEEDLQRAIGGLLAKPWPEGRSPWEMLFVQNFTKKDSTNPIKRLQTIIIFRLHHGMGDGYCYMKLIQYLAQNKNDIQKFNVHKLNRWEKLLFAVSLPFKLPYDFAQGLVESFDGPNCWHFFRKELSRKYLCSFTKPIPTDLIKKIKVKHGVSYNDVLFAAICGALKRIMKESGQNVPEDVSCVFPLPLPNHPDGIANHMTIAFAKWPIGLKATPVQRLQALSTGMKKSKYFTGPLATHLLKNKLGSIFPNYLNRRMHQIAFSTLGVSCFPGPTGSPLCFGIKVEDIMAGVGLGLAQMGATIVLFSSWGKQRFLATIDQTVCPSKEVFQKFGSFVEEELEVLWNEEETEEAFKQK